MSPSDDVINDLVAWLQAKYRRHGEIENEECANAIRELRLDRGAAERVASLTQRRYDELKHWHDLWKQRYKAMAAKDSITHVKRLEADLSIAISALQSIVTQHNGFCEHHTGVSRHSYDLADTASEALLLIRERHQTAKLIPAAGI